MEGYLKWKNSFIFMRVWVIVDGQELTYYEYFDQQEQVPKKIKGSLHLKEATILKLQTEQKTKDYGLKIKTAKGKATFYVSEPNLWNSWFNILNRAAYLHHEIEERQQRPHLLRKILDIPESTHGKLTKAMITKAYKKLSLKEHPDKGGNPDKFHEIHEAYKLLLILQREEWEIENSRTIRYEAIVEKVPGIGLGLSVTEDKTKGRIFVSNINPDLRLLGITEESEGEIEMNDTLIGIDKDDCSHWLLSRIRARLDNFRCPIGSKVTFTFERRIPLENYNLDDDSSSVSPLSPLRDMGRFRSFFNTGEDQASSSSPVKPSAAAERVESEVNKEAAASNNTETDHQTKAKANEKEDTSPIFAMPPSPPAPAEEKEEETAAEKTNTNEDQRRTTGRRRRSSLQTSQLPEEKAEDTPPAIIISLPPPISTTTPEKNDNDNEEEEEEEDDDLSQESYHYGKGRQSPSPSSFRSSNNSWKKDSPTATTTPIIINPAIVVSEEKEDSSSIPEKYLDTSYFIAHNGPVVIIDQPEDEDQLFEQQQQLLQKELQYRAQFEREQAETLSAEDKRRQELDQRLSLLQVELEESRRKEIRLQESNEQLNTTVQQLLEQQDQYLIQQMEQEKHLYEQSIKIQQLNSDQLSWKRLFQQELPHHIQNQNKAFLFQQYQLLQQQYYQFHYYTRQQYEEQLQRYRSILYGQSPLSEDREKSRSGLDFSPFIDENSNEMATAAGPWKYHETILQNMEQLYTQREEKAKEIEERLHSILFPSH